MKDWLKGLILLTIGNVLYEVIPIWVTDYLLKQSNPLYSVGRFLKNLPSIQDLITGNISSSGGLIIGFVGLLMIIYGLYLFVKDLYRKS
jgi:hypothetical protein